MSSLVWEGDSLTAYDYFEDGRQCPAIYPSFKAYAALVLTSGDLVDDSDSYTAYS